MPRLAANLSMMFNEVPFLDRFGLPAPAWPGSRAWSSCSPTTSQPRCYVSVSALKG